MLRRLRTPLFLCVLLWGGLARGPSAPFLGFDPPREDQACGRVARFIWLLWGAPPELQRNYGIRLAPEPLGRGASGRVWIGTTTNNGQRWRLIVKEVLPRPNESSADVARSLDHEAAIYNQLYPGRARRISADGKEYLVMEFLPAAQNDSAPAPTLATLIARRNARAANANLPDPRDVEHALVTELQFLHARGVTHRDIKPENVLMYQDESGRWLARIIDYDLSYSEAHPSPRPTGAICGTPPYMDRDAWRGQANAASDVEALRRSLLDYYVGYRIAANLQGTNVFSRQFGTPESENSMPPIELTPTLDLRNGKALGKTTEGYIASSGSSSVSSPRGWLEPLYFVENAQLSPSLSVALQSRVPRTAEDLRFLLNAARSPSTFSAHFTETWSNAWTARPDAGSREDLALDLFRSRSLGPEIFSRLPVEQRRAVLRIGRDLLSTRTRSTLGGYDPAHASVIEAFLRNPRVLASTN